MKKYILIGALLMTILISGFSVGETPKRNRLELYDEIIQDLDVVQIMDSSDLTMEALKNRKGKIIIEQCIGIVTSSKGDGKILNGNDLEYDYINYGCVEDINVGDIILTYFVYNPDNNVPDDIIYRTDYIIDK
jgi:hypothetical protein